jgi:hypothetical protein
MSRAQKSVVLPAGAAAAALVAYRIYLAMLPEEARIRRLVQGIAESFNEGSVGGITGHLAEDFREERTSLGREELRLVLAQLFLARRNASGGLLDRVELPPGGVEVEFDEKSPDTARIRVVGRFTSRAKSGEEREEAVVEFSGDLGRVDGRWLLRRASHKLVSGRWPF